MVHVSAFGVFTLMNTSNDDERCTRSIWLIRTRSGLKSRSGQRRENQRRIQRITWEVTGDDRNENESLTQVRCSDSERQDSMDEAVWVSELEGDTALTSHEWRAVPVFSIAIARLGASWKERSAFKWAASERWFGESTTVLQCPFIWSDLNNDVDIDHVNAKKYSSRVSRKRWLNERLCNPSDAGNCSTADLDWAALSKWAASPFGSGRRVYTDSTKWLY